MPTGSATRGIDGKIGGRVTLWGKIMRLKTCHTHSRFDLESSLEFSS